jgi:GTP-sensing pleiotropic transcriptional regulator CodY
VLAYYRNALYDSSIETQRRREIKVFNAIIEYIEENEGKVVAWAAVVYAALIIGVPLAFVAAR